MDPIAPKSQTTFRFYSSWGPIGTVAVVIAGLLFLLFKDAPRSPWGEALFMLGLAFLPWTLDVERHLARLLRIVRATGTTPVGQAGPGYVELAGRAEAHGPCAKARRASSGGACPSPSVPPRVGEREAA